MDPLEALESLAMTTEEIIVGLREEIATRKAELARLEGALDVLAPTTPAADAEPEPAALPIAPAVNGAGPNEPEPRPPLREAVRRQLRDGNNVPMTLTALAERLYARGWLGGNNGRPSRESVRQVASTMQADGLARMWVPPNEKENVVQLVDEPA